jgi:hypothetical protein
MWFSGVSTTNSRCFWGDNPGFGAKIGHELRNLGKKKQRFDAGKFRDGFGRGLTQAVDTCRTSADNPKLIKVLRDDVELVPLMDEAFDSIEGRLVHRMAWLGEPSQDVGINKIIHSPRPA